MGTPVGMGMEICEIMVSMAAIIPARARSRVEMRLTGDAVVTAADSFECIVTRLLSAFYFDLSVS